MERVTSYLGIGFLALLAQLTLADWINILGIQPDFITLLVIYIGYREGKGYGIVFGFLLGLLQDLTAASAFVGLSALIKSILGFSAGFLYGKYNVMNPIFLYILVASLILFDQVLYYGIYYAASPLRFGALLQHFILPSFAYTTVIGSVLLLVLPLQLREA
ncbi:MAG TPA: rod shape-determining protein MreD [bacterium]|nr:rod shape-determining protein MreD [bacterium]